MEQVALEEPEELALGVDVESSTRFCVKHQLILAHSRSCILVDLSPLGGF